MVHCPHEICAEIHRKLGVRTRESKCLIVQHFGDAHRPFPARDSGLSCIGLEQWPKVCGEATPRNAIATTHRLDQRCVRRIRRFTEFQKGFLSAADD